MLHLVYYLVYTGNMRLTKYSDIQIVVTHFYDSPPLSRKYYTMLRYCNYAVINQLAAAITSELQFFVSDAINYYIPGKGGGGESKKVTSKHSIFSRALLHSEPATYRSSFRLLPLNGNEEFRAE